MLVLSGALVYFDSTVYVLLLVVVGKHLNIDAKHFNYEIFMSCSE